MRCFVCQIKNGPVSAALHSAKFTKVCPTLRHTRSRSASTYTLERHSAFDIFEQQRLCVHRPRLQALARATSIGSEMAGKPAQQQEGLKMPSGDTFPWIGFGTSGIPSPDSIRHAFAAGYRNIDDAAAYGNEAENGSAIGEFLKQHNRKEIFVTSKLWQDKHHPDSVRKSCQQSIRDLQCQYLDLYLIHWPEAFKPGTKEPETDFTLFDTWKAMERLVDEGLARNVGVSNFSLSQVQELKKAARIPIACNQVEIHPMLSNDKLVKGCQALGVHMVAYSPLGHSPKEILGNAELVNIAKAAGKTPSQLCLRWNLDRGVAVIPESGSPEHIQENIEGIYDWKLPADIKNRMDALNRDQRVIDPTWHDWTE
ncbi:hypothetical protein WJX74_007427 [Apatococcus lobatus]|uniref:NADP-dependent oxidoreductase domain-containing protein n=1 Tax=Apatococcus lobatus TaxID=904363 RepID=A0AAW1RFI8_9CHLO